jgi:hypothetical protein
MRPHRARWIVASALVCAGAWTACGFPEVSFLPDGLLDGGGEGSTTSDGSSGTDGATADGGSDAPPPPVNVEDGGELQDAEVADVVIIDPTGCTTCDCDDDGYDEQGCDGGKDCDDLIAAINPDAGFKENIAWPSQHLPQFDWNCDGDAGKRFLYNGVCDLWNCRDGFRGDPPCGKEELFIRCKPKIGVGGVQLGCEDDLDNSELRTQACR